MTVRYLHLLLRQSEEVHLGKKSRTICRGPLASDQMWVGSRIAAAWEKSLHLMTEVTDAMTARGFTGEFRVPAGRALGAAGLGVCGAGRRPLRRSALRLIPFTKGR